MVQDKEFAERINPRQFNFSPKLVAIVGAIIGHDYGVRDGRGEGWATVHYSDRLMGEKVRR